MPHSLEGLANISLTARNASLTRQRNSARGALSTVRENRDEAVTYSWYWRLAFKVMAKLFAEVAKRHPNDPLFKATGRKLPDGQPELVYHQLVDRYIAEEGKDMPGSIPRGHQLNDFIKGKF